jgi:hypothetical protein
MGCGSPCTGCKKARWLHRGKPGRPLSAKDLAVGRNRWEIPDHAAHFWPVLAKISGRKPPLGLLTSAPQTAILESPYFEIYQAGQPMPGFYSVDLQVLVRVLLYGISTKITAISGKPKE